MKKLICILMTLAIIMTVSASLAEVKPDVPTDTRVYSDIADYDVEDFAKLKVKMDEFFATVTLSKPVDSIQANWMGYQESPEELFVSEDLTANYFLLGHKYQVGTHWINSYWTPYLWENDHDVYFSFGEDQKSIDAKIATVWEYVQSAEYRNGKDAEELSWAKDVHPDVVVVMPLYTIYVLEAVDDEGDEAGEVGVYLKKKNLEVFDYGTDLKVIEEAYEKWVKAHPELVIYKDEEPGHAWGRMVGREYFKSEGEPNYAYITKQGDFTVVYGRNGTIRYFEKTVENADLFGIGAGTAKFRFERNNVGWYPARVRMEFTEGVYQAVTANYDGNGQLYGIGLNYLDK